MYFKQFEKIFYDIQDKSNDSTLRILTDITTNVRVRKEVLQNITLFDEYDIKEGETPEIIAEKYYGNPELHWVIMLVNEKYDYLNDFPLTTQELYEFTIEKYGLENINQIHHYEKNGLIVQATGILKINMNVFNAIKKDDIIQNENVFARIISKSNSPVGPVAEIAIEKGLFVPNEQLTISGVRLNESTLRQEFVTLLNYQIPTNAFQVAPEFVGITNMEHEEKVNEGKRRIKLISPNLINQIVSEFRELV